MYFENGLPPENFRQSLLEKVEEGVIKKVLIENIFSKHDKKVSLAVSISNLKPVNAVVRKRMHWENFLASMNFLLLKYHSQFVD